MELLFFPSRKSDINPDHLSYFQFTGRIIGMGIFHEQPLDIHFSRFFYKLILNSPLEIDDLIHMDPEYHTHLKWLLDNDINDKELELFFTYDCQLFGKLEQIELKPNGFKIPVTDENKEEYVRLTTEYRMRRAIQTQIEYFQQGLFEIIPKNWLSIFNHYEIELLISGLPQINLEDWKKNTEYVSYDENSPQIIWFWDWINSLGYNEKAAVLQFATGTSCVPLGGFALLKGISGLSKFTLKRVQYRDQYPTAATCFNSVSLPEYTSHTELSQRCGFAIKHCSYGFGLH